MEHRPTENKTTCKLILGTDKTGTPLHIVEVNESYSGNYKVGLSADQDSLSYWAQFADLEITYP